MSGRRVLVVRPDGMGDVLLAGPAIRAVATRSTVTVLASPAGAQVARLLPGVHDVLVARVPWIDAEPQAVTVERTRALVARVGAGRFDEAIVLTSFHQSPLPTALLLRLAGVPRIGAISEDYPGSLLDVRHLVAEDVHEVERASSLAQAMGYALPAGDDGRLAVRAAPEAPGRRAGPRGGYVVVHPGATAPARTWSGRRFVALVDALARHGWPVAVTGGPHESTLTAAVAGHRGSGEVIDLGGRLALDELASVLRDAAAVVVGNTGPAHLAAAVRTPVVSVFAPTVPAARWRPWGVPHVLLGTQDIGCAGCRARTCPIEGQPCLASVTVDRVLDALEQLVGTPPRARAEVAVEVA